MISFLFFAVYAALLGVYGLFLFRMRRGIGYVVADTPRYTVPAENTALPHVTVIVPLRNEEATVAGLVDSLKAQQYPDSRLEFILVNDGSTDGTVAAVEQAIAAAAMKNVTLQHLRNGQHGKKAAIAAAIDAARGEVILTTDADCTHGPEWVEAMATPFTHGADVTAGPVVISERSTLFSRLQAMDFLGLMGVGAGFFGIGFPRLCNGANFAYRKALFHKAGGFAGNEGISSGDDEFLLHKIAYELRGEAVFTADSRAVVSTPHVAGLTAFLMQRSRWASKGARYADGGFVAFLVMLFAFYLLSVLLPGVALLSPLSFFAAVAVFILKSWIELSTLVSAARMLQQPIRIIDFFIAELLHPFYLVTVTIAGTFGVGTWKGRKLELNK